MPVKVVLPTAFIRHTDGQKQFASTAADLPGLLADLQAYLRPAVPAHWLNPADDTSEQRDARAMLARVDRAMSLLPGGHP